MTNDETLRMAGDEACAYAAEVARLKSELATLRAAQPEELRLAREHADALAAAWNERWRLADAHRNNLIDLLRRLRANHPNNSISVGQEAPGHETQALWAEVDRELAMLPNARLTDEDLRLMWLTAGGRFHGPITETGTMPEATLLPFLRGLLSRGAQPEDFTFVWIIEFREHPDSVHLACVTTSQEKALAWIKAQKPDDWSGGWWAVYREALDTDPLDAPENHLALYDLQGNELEEPPHPQRPSRDLIVELRMLECGATPAPWVSVNEVHQDMGEETRIATPAGETVVGTAWYDGMHLDMREPDRALIVGMRNAVPTLLNRLLYAEDQASQIPRLRRTIRICARALQHNLAKALVKDEHMMLGALHIAWNTVGRAYCEGDEP